MIEARFSGILAQGVITEDSMGESFSAELPAGNYFIEIKLDGVTIMELDAGYIPAGVDVAIRATLGAQKTPTLRVVVK